MSKPTASPAIRLRGVRHNNLKHFDLDLPLRQLIVVTGLSGSGKSSLAFDTLFAEGQRRYIETFSPYARQFFDRMDKPQVDSIEGIPPAIAIEQRNSVRTTRSTVGTMTEICDYMKILWPHVAQLYCRKCGRPVRKDSPHQIWQTLANTETGAAADSKPETRNAELLITFDLPLTEKLSLEESLRLITKQGYQRLLVPRERAASTPPSTLELNETQAQWGTLRNPTLPIPPGGARETDATTPVQYLSREGAAAIELRSADFSPLPSAPGETTGSGLKSAPHFLRTPPDSATVREGTATARSLASPPPVPQFEIVRVDEAVDRLKRLKPNFLKVVQDRVKLAAANRARFVEACEQAYHFGKGKLTVHVSDPDSASANQSFNGSTPWRINVSTRHFSNRFHCADCDIEYRESSPVLFSFNHPLGACPTCRGFGRTISIDYDLALPDRTKTLAEGVVKPWLSGQSAECQEDLMKFCRIRKAPIEVPFERLPKKWQDWVVNGDPDYGKDAGHEWPRAWYGVKGYFRWLESKAYKMHVRVLLSRYRAYSPCPDCRGKRFQPESLLYKLTIDDLRFTRRRPNEGAGTGEDASIAARKSQITLADFYQLPIRDSLRVIELIAAQHPQSDPIGLVLQELRSRLGYLVDVGLGYLAVDRPMRSLSGGETERVNLTTCLGTRLVNTLYVLDEPSVGLHPRDTGRLIQIIEQLRDLGNTVVVVEHEASVIRAANRIVDLGPGHGEAGGHLVFQGSYPQILKSKESLTGQYLSGRKQIQIPQRRQVKAGQASRLSCTGQPISDSQAVVGQSHDSAAPGRRDACPALTIHNATLHNLQDITVRIPLGRFVCVTGVSGSGKTTLVREVLLPALDAKLKSQRLDPQSLAGASDRSEDQNEDEDDSPATLNSQPSTTLTGSEHVGRAVLVDQSSLGKTPRSNPAVYIGAFEDIRELFAQTDAAKQRGLNASAFSFNSTQGQCERCRGAGFEKIEMQFLSDVFIRCPDCGGRRYRPHILEVKVGGPGRLRVKGRAQNKAAARSKPSTPNSKAISTSSWSIADLLEATVDEVIEFLAARPESRAAGRAVEKLALLQEVGLGYLRLGQPINTLSGGESQRLKLVSHLAESRAGVPPAHSRPGNPSRSVLAEPQADGPYVFSGVRPSSAAATSASSSASACPNPTGSPYVSAPEDGRTPLNTYDGPEGRRDACPTLFLFDEPTTGLHFDDVRVLLKVFQRLVDAGHSVVVIEHNLDVIKCADWLIDLGPDAGDEGGQIVAQGAPEDIGACPASHTGRFLREVLTAASPSRALSSGRFPDPSHLKPTLEPTVRSPGFSRPGPPEGGTQNKLRRTGRGAARVARSPEKRGPERGERDVR